jgi:recombination protein RecA
MSKPKSTKTDKPPQPTLLERLQKDHGESIQLLGGKARAVTGVVSTGSMGLDRALGIGGLPYGRIVEVYGPESAGKTTLTLHVLANAQRAGKTCAFIDAEHALDPGWAARLGVQTDDLLISQPDHGEQALNILQDIVASGEVGVVVVDSVAALTPKAELDGEIGDCHVGLQARMMGQSMRKLTAVAAKTGTLVVFLNQLRATIGGLAFGPKETTTGGKALRFHASVRLDIRRVGKVKEGELVTGNRTRVKVVKNKLAPPHQECEFDLVFGHGGRWGIDRPSEVLDHCLANGTLVKRGSHIWMGDPDGGAEKLGASRAEALATLAGDRGILDRLAGGAR